MLLTCISSGQLYQQRWNKTESISTESAAFVKVGPLGESYVTFKNGQDVVLIRYTPTGAVAWTRTISFPSINFTTQIKGLVANEFMVYVIANSDAEPIQGDTTRARLIGFTSSGGSLGEKEFFQGDKTAATDITLGSNGQVYVIGTSSFGAGNSALTWVLKYEPDLDEIWQKSFPPAGFAQGSGQVRVTDGEVFFTGSEYPTDFVSSNFMLNKLDADGNLLWKRTYTFDPQNFSAGLELSLEGDPVALIKSVSTSNTRAIAHKWTRDGTAQWSHVFTTDANGAQDLEVGPFNVFFCGMAIVSGTQRGYVRCLSLTSGALAWSTYMTEQANPPRTVDGIALDSYGFVHAAGTAGTGNARLFRTLKLNPANNGSIVWSSNFTGIANEPEVVAGIDVSLPLGDVVVVGASGSSPECVTVNYRQAPISGYDVFIVQPNLTTSIPAAKGVLTNDRYVDQAELNEVVITDNPDNGTLSPGDNGAFNYSPVPGFTGQDSFSYQVKKGSLESAVMSSNIFVVESAQLKSFAINPTSVTSGASTTGDCKLTTAAFTLNNQVAVTDNSTAVVTPSTVTVPAGAPNVFFPIDTLKVAANATRTVTVTYNGTSKTASVTLLAAAAALSHVTLSPNLMPGGSASTGTVHLDRAAPAGGASVALADGSSAITVPASVLVPAGQLTANFAVQTSAVAQTAYRSITASYAGVTRSVAITLTPAPALASLTLSPTTVVGGQSTTGTVRMTVTARTALTVALSDNTSAITPPPSLSIPVGYDNGKAVIQTSPVSSTYVRTVTATYNGVSKSANLTLTP